MINQIDIRSKNEFFKQQLNSLKSPVIFKAEQNANVRKFSTNVLSVVATLVNAGFVAYIVGGAVRDLLLSRKPKDFDIVTSAKVSEVISLFGDSCVSGKFFTIVLVRVGGEFFEVTSFRHVYCAETCSKLDREFRLSKYLQTLQLDMLYRDFTINALFYDPGSDEIIDCCGGIDDLKNKIIRSVGDPKIRFFEDPLQMLRAVRFAEKYEFKIESNASSLLPLMAQYLKKVPIDRLLVEIVRQLTGGRALATMRYLCAVGLQQELLPSLDALLSDSKDGKFLQLVLTSIDESILNNRTISNEFIFAALIWPSVRKKWTINRSQGASNSASLSLACQVTLNQQPIAFGLKERLGEKIMEIWATQIFFEMDKNQSSFNVIKKNRFRPGLNLLLLRCEAGDVDAAIGNWWSDFFVSDTPTRLQLNQQRLKMFLG